MERKAIRPEDFPRKCFVEALRIADSNTIKLMFEEADEGKINRSLEKYKSSLSPASGRIIYAELGWQQFGRVPVVALIRYCPKRDLIEALYSWCFFIKHTEDIYEDYKRRVLYVHNKPIVIDKKYTHQGGCVFLYGVPEYITIFHTARFFLLKYRQAVGFENDLGKILAFSDADVRELSQWQRGRTRTERNVEFYLVQKLLFGLKLRKTKVDCLVNIEKQQLKCLRGLLDSDYPIEQIKQRFYDLSYTKKPRASAVRWETYPKWHFNLNTSFPILFFKRLSENVDLKKEYKDELYYWSTLRHSHEVKVDVEALRETWQNYPDPAKNYLNLLLKKETLGPALTWAPYQNPNHQLCACYITFYFFSPSRIKQTRKVAQLIRPNKLFALILKWSEYRTEKNISNIVKHLEFKEDYNKFKFDFWYSAWCSGLLPVPEQFITDTNSDTPKRSCEELRLVRGKGKKYGLLFCNEALSSNLEGKAKRYYVMSNVDPSETPETILRGHISCLPKEYIGTENATLAFRKIKCKELPPPEDDDC